ncbi:hypothetical protein ACJMK2_011216 [Sinanodonta woodiana]|uniref:Endoplasmic reticulum-based factor for assembly of v-atpase n=1 Tax=Sinanodonta woodiana TaxID=1069815 RepID=A0ABD3V499_SINWO
MLDIFKVFKITSPLFEKFLFRIISGAMEYTEVEVLLTPSLLSYLNEAITCGCRDDVKKYILEYTKSTDVKTIKIKDVKSLHKVINDIRCSADQPKVYLHEMLEGSDLHIPEFKCHPRNPILEARIKRLQAQQENREYNKMVRNVQAQPDDFVAVGKDYKDLNRQLITILNFVVTVGGSFAFGYKATEYAFGDMGDTFLLQMVVGLILAAVVFIADMYFLIKSFA